MPTTAQVIFSNQKLEPALRDDLAVAINIRLPASVNYTKGTLLGELTATPGTFAAYGHGNSDGSQNPKAVLPYDVATDPNGNITLTSTTGQAGGEFGQSYPSIDAYFAGWFRLEDLLASATGVIDINAFGADFILKQGSLTGGSGLVELV